jgi:adenylate cyclase
MQDTLKVGDWTIKPDSGQIFKDNKEHRLEPKAMAVLVYLAEHSGEIVTRSELEGSVWQGSVVTYEALTVTINKIRAALEDDSRKPRYIETLAKRGYRLIAPVTIGNTSLETPIVVRKTNLLKPVFFIIVVSFTILILLFLFNQNKNNNKQLKLPQNVPSIAVIPFANNNNDSAQDYFAAGITEYLITDLSRLSSLLVTSRNSVLGFNSKTIDLKKAGKVLNTQYILTGSVLKNKKQIRIAVQLNDVANGVQLWANRYDRNVDDLFSVQDEIINKIVTALVKQVGLTHKGFISRNYTASHEAHDYYTRGNALYTSISKEGNSLAREMFLKAIEIDSKFSSAYSAIALTYIDDYRRKWGKDPGGAVDRAFEYANKAISIDENTAVAHVVLAYAHLYGRKQPEKSIMAARQAIKLYPNYADAYAIIGSAYSFVDRSVDAIRINKHAIRLNPTSSYIYLSNLGRDYYFLKRHNKAIESLQDAIFRNENYLNAHLYLAATYASLNQLEDASWEAEKILILDPEFSLKYWAKTQPYKSKSRLARMVTDLRKAGLPD